MKNNYKRLLLIFIGVWIFVWSGWTQEGVKQHVVQRGETVEFIAKRYQVSVDEIKSSNPNVAAYYTGLIIVIPEKHEAETLEKQGMVASAVDNSDIPGVLYRQASLYIKEGEYRKATDILTQIIERNSSAQVYLHRGYCYYERKKYKQATEDCATALRCKDCDEQTKKYCHELIGQIGTLRAERAERRGQFFAGMLAIGAQTAMSVMEAKAANENAKAYNNVLNGGGGMNSVGMGMLQSNANFNVEVSRQLQNLALMSVHQVQQQELNEYKSAAVGWKQTTGKELSYQEWCAMKGEAIQRMKQAGNDNGVSCQTTGRTIQSAHTNQDVNASRQCPYCKGKGRIVKDIYPAMFGMRDSKVECEECGGIFLKSTGHVHLKCGHCDGTGQMK